MLRDRPRLLVIDDDPARRIAFTATLGASFDAWATPDGEDPIRAARAQRPDLAVVVDGGRVVEQGRHAELLAAGGLYAGLWQRQQAEGGA